MIDFDQVILRLKMHLTQQMHKEKILDKEIAAALKLDPQYYAVIKRRKRIPYEAIAHFSQSENLNMNWLLLDQQPQHL